MARPEAIIAVLAALASGSSPANAQCAGIGARSDYASPGSAGTTDVRRETDTFRSPGLAAALSLTPVPVDFGNLYAEKVGWGIAYTTVQLGLMTPMLFLAADHGMGHSGTSGGWSTSDRNWMIGLVSSYVAVKVVAGLHAAHNAEVFNHDRRPARFSAVVLPTDRGGLAFASLRF